MKHNFSRFVLFFGILILNVSCYSFEIDGFINLTPTPAQQFDERPKIFLQQNNNIFQINDRPTPIPLVFSSLYKEVDIKVEDIPKSYEYKTYKIRIPYSGVKTSVYATLIKPLSGSRDLKDIPEPNTLTTDSSFSEFYQRARFEWDTRFKLIQKSTRKITPMSVLSAYRYAQYSNALSKRWNLINDDEKLGKAIEHLGSEEAKQILRTKLRIDLKSVNQLINEYNYSKFYFLGKLYNMLTNDISEYKEGNTSNYGKLKDTCQLFAQLFNEVKELEDREDPENTWQLMLISTRTEQLNYETADATCLVKDLKNGEKELIGDLSPEGVKKLLLKIEDLESGIKKSASSVNKRIARNQILDINNIIRDNSNSR